jgi:chromate reductase, NAD(P)H dehydrogenase (quinone)
VATNATILAFAGSASSNSLNKLLIRIAAEGARDAGGVVTLIDLRDFPMPLYDCDVEATDGLPPNALALKRLFAQHRGLLIATPEYNASVPAVLKNAIDWVSRSAPGETALASLTGKIAALLSASPSPLGGIRGQLHLRQILGTINVVLLSQQWRIPFASAASFDDKGNLTDARSQAMARDVGAELVRFLLRVSP